MEAPNDRRAHRLAMATAVAFAVSLAFPIGAGLYRNPAGVSPIWGILDVLFAFVLAAFAITIAVLYERRVTDEIRLAAFRIYRQLINLILVLIVIFLVAGDNVRWPVLLVGVCWRGWLVFYALPPWLAAWRGSSMREPAPGAP